MPQSHCFKVMELALKAEAMATRLGNLRDSLEPPASLLRGALARPKSH
jgi:hypothetical protein